MQFRTEFNFPPSPFQITHENKVMMIGSCFSEYISEKLQNAGFNIRTNPFGILFNPDSIKNCIRSIVAKKEFRKKDFFLHNEKWNSFYLHGDFSASTAEEASEKINISINEVHDFVKQAEYIFITLGTAWVYEQIETKKIVANCHKVPNKNFEKKKMGVNDIVSDLSYVINHLKNFNPDIKVIFTISPVRHLKDGFIENQWSKSTLNVAVHELLRRHEDVFYFPSFELIIDDLRDYRFFKSDMVHPTENAIDYVWEKFRGHYFSKSTMKLSEEVEQLKKNLQHKPFNADSAAHKSFLIKTEKEHVRLKKILPHLQFK